MSFSGNLEFDIILLFLDKWPNFDEYCITYLLLQLARKNKVYFKEFRIQFLVFRFSQSYLESTLSWQFDKTLSTLWLCNYPIVFVILMCIYYFTMLILWTSNPDKTLMFVEHMKIKKSIFRFWHLLLKHSLAH